MVLLLDLSRRKKREEEHEHYQELRSLKWIEGILMAGLVVLIVAAVPAVRYVVNHVISSVASVPPPENRLSTEAMAPAGEVPRRAGPTPSPVPSSTLALMLSAMGLLGVLAIVAFRRGGHGSPLDNRLSPQDGVSTGLAETRHRLELGDEVRDAVIACYVDMCRLFADETSRASCLTAREFEKRLRSHGAGEAEISTLTDAFEKARYSREACTEVDRANAIKALLSLERHYKGEAP
jgi:hypothetical protein